MPTSMLSRTQRRTAAGWTAASIAHDQALHDAAHKTLEPTAAQKSLLTDFTGRILGYGSAPAGVPIGMANTSENAGIPATIQAAMQNLNTNTQTSQLGTLMQKFLAAIGGTGGPAVVVNASSPAMDQYYQNKNQIMQQPAQIQASINAAEAAKAKATPTGVMSITPGIPGSYSAAAQSNQNRLVDLYGEQANARQAAQSTGWLPYMPTI